MRAWATKHRDLLIIAALAVALAMVSGYNIWAARVSHKNAHTAALATGTAKKVTRLSKSQCGSTVLLYDLLNALMDDTSPSFGSPPDGPIIPGARAKLIGQVHTAEKASYAALRKQGCHLTPP